MDSETKSLGRRNRRIGCLVLAIGLCVMGGRTYLLAQKVKQEAAELCAHAQVGSELDVEGFSRRADAYGFDTAVSERPTESLLMCIKHVFGRSHYVCGIYYREGVITRTELAWAPD